MKGLKKRQIMTIVALMLLTATLTYCITVYWSQNQYNDLLEDLKTATAGIYDAFLFAAESVGGIFS